MEQTTETTKTEKAKKLTAAQLELIDRAIANKGVVPSYWVRRDTVDILIKRGLVRKGTVIEDKEYGESCIQGFVRRATAALVGGDWREARKLLNSAHDLAMEMIKTQYYLVEGKEK